MRPFTTLVPALAAGLALLAAPALAGPREDRAIDALLAPQTCTLQKAIDQALESVPGFVHKARLVVSTKPGGERIYFFKVVVRSDAGEPEVLRYDARSCQPVEPTPPEITALEAIDAALDEVPGVALATALRFPGLEPVYRVFLLTPRLRKLEVIVDGISGEVLRVGRLPRHAYDDGDSDLE